MEYKKLKNILLEFGYTINSVKSILIARTRPTLLKAIELEQKYNIPCSAWENIRLFITSKENDTQHPSPKTTTKQNEQVAS